MTGHLPTTAGAAWVPGAASGSGVLPGTDIDEATRTIAGELTALPFQPDLPDRGVGADPLGRCIGLLVDLHAEVVPSGWRVTARPGRDVMRANDFRERDLDAVELQLVGAPALKIQLLGPWSLVAQLETRTGHRAVTDAGAVQDLVESYGEGLRRHLAELSKRLPGTSLLVQVEEPELERVLAGALPTASGFGTVRAVSADRTRQLLESFAATVTRAHPNTSLALTGVRPGTWWSTLQRSGYSWFAAALDDLERTSSLDVIGEAIGEGAGLLMTVRDSDAPDLVERTCRRLLAGWRALGFPEERLARTVVPVAGTPTALPAVAAGLRSAAQVGAALLDPPSSWRDGPVAAGAERH